MCITKQRRKCRLKPLPKITIKYKQVKKCKKSIKDTIFNKDKNVHRYVVRERKGKIGGKSLCPQLHS